MATTWSDQRVALLKDDPDQVIAGGVVEIEHASILRLS